MLGLGSPFGGSDATFDERGTFDSDHLPDPDEFLEGHSILTDQNHVTFHETTRELFEERGVYDVTFDYNLAELNRDRRHEDAGFRYAEETGTDDYSVDEAVSAEELPDRVLRAEFTPTTKFCPQTATLTKGAFRAWNGLSDRHEYDLVRVRAASLHHDSESVNEELQSLESRLLQSGDDPSVCDPTDPTVSTERAGPTGTSERPGSTDESRSDDLPF